MGSPRQGQPLVTWAMIRRVTTVRVCWSGVSGTLSVMSAVMAARPGWCHALVRLSCAAG
jgi:hypothetical protein